MKNKIRILFLISFVLLPLFASGQKDESIGLVYQSSMLGIGSTKIYDTYLSPLEYSGTTIGLFHEQMKMTKIMNGKVASQQLFKLDFSWADNKMETASDYSGFIDYNYGLHYRFRPINKFQFFVGPQADGSLGFIYNSRNGNNPATAKVNLNLNLSMIATYNLAIKSQPFKLRYQACVPFVGLMFSPHYGQSYYEIGLGDNDDLVHFASFHNQLSMKNIVSLEVPFQSMTLRFSYINSIYETDINNLQTKIHSNSFFFGFSKNFFSVPGNKPLKSNYKQVFE